MSSLLNFPQLVRNTKDPQQVQVTVCGCSRITRGVIIFKGSEVRSRLGEKELAVVFFVKYIPRDLLESSLHLFCTLYQDSLICMPLIGLVWVILDR